MRPEVPTQDIEIATELLVGAGVANLEIEDAATGPHTTFAEEVDRYGRGRTPERLAQTYDALPACCRGELDALINDALFDVDDVGMVVVM